MRIAAGTLSTPKGRDAKPWATRVRCAAATTVSWICLFAGTAASETVADDTSPSVPSQTNPDDPQDGPRGRTLQLLALLHDSDVDIARGALAELQRRGLADDDLEFGSKLFDPRPELRIELARQLPEVDAGTREAFQRILAQDPDDDVRRAASESLLSSASSAELLNRPEEGTEDDLGEDAIAVTVQVGDEESPTEGPELFGNRPSILEPPTEIEHWFPAQPELAGDPFGQMLRTETFAPLGFTGPSGIAPLESQESSDFVPVEDRWRLGFPTWDRYGRGHRDGEDYPYVEGHLWDPYNQNVLKGDYPIIGQHTFLNVTGSILTSQEFRQVPTAITAKESHSNPFDSKFFGNPNQFFSTNNFAATFELTHGNAGFKPPDWVVRVTPIFNFNYLQVQELGVVDPDVEDGTTRFRDQVALQEWFFETKLADTSPNYDFVSVRAGSQPFISDFRGFIFSDTNRAVRLFGTNFSNRDQFNLIFFDQTEKNTNSFLNTFDDRHQNTLIANYYRQDFLVPGYTAQASFHFNRDGPSFKFDNDRFLVRPDPVGVFQEHRVDSYYFGLAGDGHWGRINMTNAFYVVTGQDTLNPLAGRSQRIDARMAALELSYDFDWLRLRTSYFYASGDKDINDRKATGFDSIFDNPNFAGGQFSYWQRQMIALNGVNLVNRFSLVPDLRSSKFQGQTNFVNPGLQLFNLGADLTLTPKLKLIGNANYLYFDKTQVLEQFVFQSHIRRGIGTDLSLGTEYRPFLNNNVILITGVSSLLPAGGFQDLYTNFKDPVSPLYAVFSQLALTY
jgi:hypothetical protein